MIQKKGIFKLLNIINPIDGTHLEVWDTSECPKDKEPPLKYLVYKTTKPLTAGNHDVWVPVQDGLHGFFGFIASNPQLPVKDESEVCITAGASTMEVQLWYPKPHPVVSKPGSGGKAYTQSSGESDSINIPSNKSYGDSLCSSLLKHKTALELLAEHYGTFMNPISKLHALGVKPAFQKAMQIHVEAAVMQAVKQVVPLGVEVETKVYVDPMHPAKSKVKIELQGSLPQAWQGLCTACGSDISVLSGAYAGMPHTCPVCAYAVSFSGGSDG